MITIYTTETCSWCKQVKQYFTNKNIEFTTVDITRDPDTARELQKKTGATSVPITTDGEEYIVGWNIGRLSAMASRQ